MKRSCFTLFWPMVIGLLLSCSYPLACMAQGVSVTVPYASTDTSWWTGVAISNLDFTASTSDVVVAFYGVDGDLLAMENIGPIGPNAAYVDLASNIYTGGALPSRYKMVIFHQDTQPLAATTFLGNAEGGFGYQTYANNTPGSEITSLPYMIVSPGFYYITKDMTCASGNHGITIEADNVTLDLMGFSLIGPGKDAGGDHSGVYMDGRSNVEIKNGTVKGFPSNGVYEGAIGGSGHRCLSLRIVGNGGNGISLSSGNNMVKGCTTKNNDNYGIYTAPGSTVTGNTCHGNGNDGIKARSGTTVTGNTCYENRQGISASSGSTVTGNTCYENSSAGIWASIGSTVTWNTCHVNGYDGINARAGSTVTGNTCYENVNRGIYAASGSTVIGNTCFKNEGWGIALGTYCFVDQNTATLNTGGDIYYLATGCVFGTNLPSAP